MTVLAVLRKKVSIESCDYVRYAVFPHVEKEPHDLALQMCFYTTLCSDSSLCVELRSRAVQAARALQGRRDLAEVLSPCYVNPVAAKRERANNRETDRQRERPGVCI